jgi:hypothetical protein
MSRVPISKEALDHLMGKMEDAEAVFEPSVGRGRKDLVEKAVLPNSMESLEEWVIDDLPFFIGETHSPVDWVKNCVCVSKRIFQYHLICRGG